MLNKGDIEKSFQEVLSSMEESVDYELTPDALEEINSTRQAFGIRPIVNICLRKYFHRYSYNLTVLLEDVKYDLFCPTLLGFSLRLPVGLAFPFAFAIAENRIQKVQ